MERGHISTMFIGLSGRHSSNHTTACDHHVC